MPTLTLRTVGMSYLVEGLPGSGLDAGRLLADLASDHGTAVAPIGAPPEAILVDRKATTWPALCDALEAWVRGAGFATTSWAKPSPEPGLAVLHFHP